MTQKKFFLIGGLLTLVMLAATIAVYSDLPAEVPRHGDLRGNVDAYMPKAMAFVTGPGLMAATMLLAWALPWLSPMGFKIERFGSTFLWVFLLTLGLLAYTHGVTLLLALGYVLNFSTAMAAGICVLAILLGNQLGKVRRNFYVGIRTPWTLADERNWNQTHRLAGKLLLGAGFVGLVLVALGWTAGAIVVFVAALVIPAIYSLVLSKRLERMDAAESR